MRQSPRPSTGNLAKRRLPAVGGLAAALLLATLVVGPVAAQDKAPSLATDLKNPESVAWLPDGRILISVIGEFGKDGDGAVLAWSPRGMQTLAEGLDDPKGLAVSQQAVFVTDKTVVRKLTLDGQTSVLAAADAFPRPPKFLNDIVADADGNLYVSDSGDLKGADGAVYRITPAGKVTLVTDAAKAPTLKAPNGLLVDDAKHLLLLDFISGQLSRLALDTGALEKLAEGFEGGDGLARDIDGNLYVSQWTTGRVSVLPFTGGPAITLSSQFTSAADTCINLKNGQLIVPDMKAGTVTALSLFSHVPRDIDTSPLSLTVEPAFEKLRFERPILLTHAGDGSNRVFVASQLGKVFVFPDDQAASKAELFFDLQERTRYADKENEEGFLGMAFHPKFKENGQFFVYYTTTEAPHLSVVSRFRVSPNNPNYASRDTEEVLLRIPQPFWNHNGGTICFGPEGYLYIALGDGGSANDPLGHGQNPATLLGSILRIDVDHRGSETPYAIPGDNPFVGRGQARGEVWAYGLRNPWRISFDRATGALWCADVGQDIWEEINLITRGGNYGWSRREAMHRFRADGAPPSDEFIEPVWEYHHDLGKSVTGGHVYRGRRLPELAGHYVYADYVTGRIWALKYDVATRKVLANRAIAGNIQPVMSFGEDEAGELYFMTVNGQLFRFAKAGG